MDTGKTVQPLYDLSFLPGYVWLIIIILGVAAFLAILYVLICGGISLRGWQSYALTYRGPSEFPGGVQTSYGESIMVGNDFAPASYRHCVTAGYSDDGLYLKMGSFFRTFHPPLFIPWNAVKLVEQKKAIKGYYTAVQFSTMPRLVLFRKFGDAVFAQWQKLEIKKEVVQ